MSQRLSRRVESAGSAPRDGESLPGGEVGQQILKNAIRLFAQKGFRGTTTREIALAAGVNEVTIFRHFSSKQDLYAAILEVKSSEAGVSTLVDETEKFSRARNNYQPFPFFATNHL